MGILILNPNWWKSEEFVESSRVVHKSGDYSNVSETEASTTAFMGPVNNYTYQNKTSGA